MAEAEHVGQVDCVVDGEQPHGLAALLGGGCRRRADIDHRFVGHPTGGGRRSAGSGRPSPLTVLNGHV